MTFLDERDVEYGALATIKVTNAVNGERSISGEIISGDYVLSHIERGWRLRFDDEYYAITYAKPIDQGQQISVSFDAVHQFFWDFDKSSVHSQLSDGSHTFVTYLDFIFAGSGYHYTIDSLLKVPAFEKQSFGYKKRLTLFNDIIKSAGVEFSVTGKVVRILERVGTDLSTVVRKNFNLNELGIEKNIGDLVTYQKGFGAWNDSDDHSKGRVEAEYISPLASVYGRLEAEPLIDERYTGTSSLIATMKANVDNSYTISVKLDMEDLTKAGYQYTQPVAGDYIMAINETLGFQEKIRIVSYTSEYDVKGVLLKHEVTCNDIGNVKKQAAGYSLVKKQAANATASLENVAEMASRALVLADGKNTVYFGTDFPVDEPKGTLLKGDKLYRTVGDKTETYYWAGSEWVLEPSVKELGDMSERVDGLMTELDKRVEATAKALLPAQSELDDWRAKLSKLNGTELTQADISVDPATGRIQLGTVELTAQNIATLLTMDKGVTTLLANKFYLGAPSENLVKLSPDYQTLTATSIDASGYYTNESADNRFWLSNKEVNPIKTGDELGINALLHSTKAQRLGFEVHFYDKDKNEVGTASSVQTQVNAGDNPVSLSLKIPTVPVTAKYYAIAINAVDSASVRAVKVSNAQVRIKSGIDMIVDGTITTALINAAEGDFARVVAKFLQAEAVSAKIAEIQTAKIDELTVHDTAWMRKLVAQQVMTELLRSLVVQADKIVIPGTDQPVFNMDRDGNLSVNTPFLKINGEAIATERALREISLTPGPKGEKGEKGDPGTFEGTIGGVNLIPGTKTMADFQQQNDWQLEPETHKGLSVWSRGHAWNGIHKAVMVYANETYTFSAYIKRQTTGLAYIFLHHWGDLTPYAEASPSMQQFDIGTDWQRISLTFKAIRTGTIIPRVEIGDEDRVFVAGYKLERGNVATDYSQAEEDVQTQLVTKADQALTQEQLNALNEQNARLTAELQAKASINEVKQVILDYEALVTARASDREFYESALKLSAERLTAMSLDLGALKKKTTFIDSYIAQSNEGLVIGRTDGSTSMLFSPNGRISMFSAGAEVMYIDKGVIHIDNGVFTKTLQIGRFVTMQHPQNPDINATYYVGERSR